MDKETLKNDFKNLIKDITDEVLNSSVFKTLEKLKKEISDFAVSFTKELKSLNKINKELPQTIDKKIAGFDTFQKSVDKTFKDGNKKLKQEVENLVKSNSQLQYNIDNNFFQLQEQNDRFQKKITGIQKMVNILLIVTVISLVGLIISLLQNQKLISQFKAPAETTVSEIEEVVEPVEEITEMVEEGLVEEPVASDDQLSKISENSREIKKLRNWLSSLDSKVKTFKTSSQIETQFQSRFTSFDEKTDNLTGNISELEKEFDTKLDNLWSFLEEKGTSKMKKAISSLND